MPLSTFKSFFRCSVRHTLLTGVCVLSFPVFASAQLDAQTGVADPGRAAQDLQKQQEMPKVLPQETGRSEQRLSAPAGAEAASFVFSGLRFEGNTVYDRASLLSPYQDRVGQKITVADLYAMANEITLKYRDAGYILSVAKIVPQTIDDTTPPLIRIVEGRLDQVRIEIGPESHVNPYHVRAYAEGIKKEGPLNMKDLERGLWLINDLPGVSARSVLSASPTVADATDLTIVVSEDSIEGQIGLTNYGSRYLGTTQASGAVSLNSFLRQNESITGQVVLAPKDWPEEWYELAYGSLSYEQPLGKDGSRIRAVVSATNTKPGYSLEPFDVEGRSYSAGVTLSHPFIRSRSENLMGNISIDWHRTANKNNVEPTRTDRITALRLGGQYQFIDQLLGLGANTASVTVSKGLCFFGASEEGRANMTRPDANPQFAKIEVALERVQRLSQKMDLVLSASGQKSAHALLSSEEFGVGGIRGGRGYDSSEIVGEDGILGTAELRWNNPVSFNTKLVSSYQLYTFYDIGTVWNVDATTSDQKRDSLVSAGAGVKMDLPYNTRADFSFAVPLTQEIGATQNNDPRFYFGITKDF